MRSLIGHVNCRLRIGVGVEKSDIFMSKSQKEFGSTLMDFEIVISVTNLRLLALADLKAVVTPRAFSSSAS